MNRTNNHARSMTEIKYYKNSHKYNKISKMNSNKNNQRKANIITILSLVHLKLKNKKLLH